MIDIQYLAVPLTFKINSLENKEVRWISLFELKNGNDVDDEIKIKVKKLYDDFNGAIN